MPRSSKTAAAKGAWQSGGAILTGLLTILTMLWFEPTVGATIAGALKDHPEWAIYYALANVIFGFVKNKLAHQSPESRLAIVGDPKVGTAADRGVRQNSGPGRF